MIKNFDDVVNNTNLKAFLHTDDIVLGKQYDANKVELSDYDHDHNKTSYHYEVDSKDKLTYFDCYIVVSANLILHVACDCKKFRKTSSCEHIAAIFYKDYDVIFEGYNDGVDNLSRNLLDLYVKSEENYIKKELKVELHIDVNKIDRYYGVYDDINIKLLLGYDKMYTLGNHVSSFKRAYESMDEEVYFGKNFTYKPQETYISEDNIRLLEAYFRVSEERFISNFAMKKFLRSIKDMNFIFNDYQINGIREEFNVSTKLESNLDGYKLSFDLDNVITVISDDYEYILYMGVMYHLNKNDEKLLESLANRGVNELIINKSDKDIFAKGLLNAIKKNLDIDSSVSDIILPSSVGVELYFDIRTGVIFASVKLLYDQEVVDIFDDSSNALRDRELESNIINDLYQWGFYVDKKNIILDDIEGQVEFIEQGLEKLSRTYAVFTTEKFKKINIRKKTNVSSMFGIGTDNILSYDFNLGDIKSDELVNIFKNIKEHKQYYRLKSGDILNLEDDDLKSLCNLTNDLEFSDEEIRAGKGSILKYRAIYLDSLKNTKYGIIKTNNLFDEFVDSFYKYKDVDISLPKSELSVLRDYQVTGVKWLYNLAKIGFGGVLADEMGLGKTIQVIYYLKQMLKDNPNDKFLVVVPTSLAYNWEHEFLMYAPEIKRVICVGSKDKRIKLLKDDKASVIITTYGLLREDKELYENKKFNTMIIDEAQNIKNSNAAITRCVKDINAVTKFALSGTPLENNVFELWSIFDFVMPGYLATLSRFQNKYKIKDFNDESDLLIKGLSKQINPFILRRKKSDVVKELPDKLINDVYIDLGVEQKKLYVAELERVKKTMDDVMNESGVEKARFLILQLLTKLRQICISPCIIYDDYVDDGGKISYLKDMVLEYINNNHKILIFSSFKTGLNLVKDALKEVDVETYMIDGSVPAKKRVEMVDSFNNGDDVKVFLIMLKSGGTGLNLTSADVVIHLDLWWNPQAENQATDRAHRIGQKNTVEVIHLITKGTIEEKILDLQYKKKMLSDKLIDGEVRDKNILGSLSKEDIQNLLSFENKD